MSEVQILSPRPNHFVWTVRESSLYRNCARGEKPQVKLPAGAKSSQDLIQAVLDAFGIDPVDYEVVLPEPFDASR